MKGGGVPQKKLLDMILWEDVERYLMDDLTLENNYGGKGLPHGPVPRVAGSPRRVTRTPRVTGVRDTVLPGRSESRRGTTVSKTGWLKRDSLKED